MKKTISLVIQKFIRGAMMLEDIKSYIIFELDLGGFIWI